MKIGVTGTREGMTKLQKRLVTEYLIEIDGDEHHHGDCIGVDREVAVIARSLGYRIIAHPPNKKALQAFYPSDETRPERPYLVRNKIIVDETNILLVVPLQDRHQPKGGTWYTHDYARQKGKPLIVFYPTKGRSK